MRALSVTSVRLCVRALWIQWPTDEGAPVQQLRRCDVTPRPDQACAQAQVDARQWRRRVGCRCRCRCRRWCLGFQPCTRPRTRACRYDHLSCTPVCVWCTARAQRANPCCLLCVVCARPASLVHVRHAAVHL